MADGTGIEWTHRAGTKGETWNPIVGCSIHSPGCTNCYAMTMAARIEAIDAAAGRTSHYAGTTETVLNRFRGELQMLDRLPSNRPPDAESPDSYGTSRSRDDDPYRRQVEDRTNAARRGRELDDEIPF